MNDLGPPIGTRTRITDDPPPTINPMDGSWYVPGTGVPPPVGGSSDARYVDVAGDTMTGPLTLSGTPTQPLHAVTKQYADAIELYAPAGMVGLVARTMEEKFTALGYFARDWGSGPIDGQELGQTLRNIFADVLRRDPSGGLEFTVWLDADTENSWHMDTPVVVPRGCRIAGVNHVNTAVIKPTEKVWTQPAFTFNQNACHMTDCQLECYTMQAGSAPGILMDGGTLTFRNVSLNTGPVPALRANNNARIFGRNLGVTAGFFGRNATPGMGIIELGNSADFVFDGFTAAGSGVLQECAAIKTIDSTEIIYLGGNVRVGLMNHLLEVPTGGSQVCRLVHIDGFTAGGNMAPNKYVIEIRPENSSRVERVYIGPHSVAGGAGAVNVHGWGFCNEVSIGTGYVEGATDYAYRILNADVVSIDRPHICAGVNGIRVGGNVPSGVDRPINSCSIIGGRIGPIGNRAGNSGVGISVASQAHGVLNIQGVDLRGNTGTDFSYGATEAQRDICVFTDGGTLRYT